MLDLDHTFRPITNAEYHRANRRGAILRASSEGYWWQWEGDDPADICAWHGPFSALDLAMVDLERNFCHAADVQPRNRSLEGD
jgi:hypothetical protein